MVAPDAAAQVRVLLLELADAGAQLLALLILELVEAVLGVLVLGLEAGVLVGEGGDAGAQLFGLALDLVGLAQPGLAARVRLAVQRRQRVGLLLERLGPLAGLLGRALRCGQLCFELCDARLGAAARVALLGGALAGFLQVGLEV